MSGTRRIRRAARYRPREATANIVAALQGPATSLVGHSAPWVQRHLDDAGERFAVRNSGVKGVVESVGDHSCEYMTGGAIVVLGEIGKNFAASMSGGVAYVYDPENNLQEQANTGMVTVSDNLTESDRAMISRLVENHAAYTDSSRAEELLANWEVELEQFTRVMPDAYAESIADSTEVDVRTELPDAATLEAGELTTPVQTGAD